MNSNNRQQNVASWLGLQQVARLCGGRANFPRGMAMRIVAIIFFVILFSVLTLALVNPHLRWLTFHGVAASKLSDELLNQQITKTPDWAINIVIVANVKEQAVSFNEHDSEFVYLYSPNKAPTLINYRWQHFVGSWYVGEIKI